MEREIDIDNEKQILKECDFDYLYNSKKCSRELCMFYNDIILSANKMQGEYDVNRAFIDLGRIAIVLNKQSARIKELEEENKQLKFDCAMFKSANYLINDVGIDKAREIMFQSEQQLKQSQNQKAIEVLEDIRKTIRRNMLICGGKATDLDVVSANAYNRCLDDMQKIIDNQIKELRSEKKWKNL